MANTDRLASIEISKSDMQLLSTTTLVDKLVARGVSRLTAERFIAIQRGSVEAGRARRHALARH